MNGCNVHSSQKSQNAAPQQHSLIQDPRIRQKQVLIIIDALATFYLVRGRINEKKKPEKLFAKMLNFPEIKTEYNIGSSAMFYHHVMKSITQQPLSAYIFSNRKQQYCNLPTPKRHFNPSSAGEVLWKFYFPP